MLNRAWVVILLAGVAGVNLPMTMAQPTSPPQVDKLPEVPPAPPEGESSPPPGISVELVDAGFDRYANLALVTDAWKQMNPGLLTDAALQFAEGERVLLRSHKAIKSAQVFDLAIRAAVEKQDKETLARLAKVFEKTGDRSRLEEITLGQKLAGVSRSTDPVLKEGTAEALEAIQKTLRLIEGARVTGDVELLNEADGELADAPVTDKQRQALKKLIQDAKSAGMSKDGAETLDLVNKLSGGSRGPAGLLPPYDRRGTLRTGANGAKYRENFWIWKDRLWVIDGKGSYEWWTGGYAEKGHYVMRESAEWVRVLWNPRTGTRQSGRTWVYVSPTDPNSIWGWENAWKGPVSLTQLIEGGRLSANRNAIVAAGGGNVVARIVAAGGGNLIGQDGASIVAAGGGNMVPRPSSPLQFVNGTFRDLAK